MAIIVKNPSENELCLTDLSDNRMLKMNYENNNLNLSLNTASPYKIFVITEDDKFLFSQFNNLLYEISNSLFYKSIMDSDNYDFYNFLRRFTPGFKEIYNQEENSIILSSDVISYPNNIFKIFYSRGEVLIVFFGIANDNMEVSLKLDSEMGEFYLPIMRMFENILNDQSIKLVKKK